MNSIANLLDLFSQDEFGYKLTEDSVVEEMLDEVYTMLLHDFFSLVKKHKAVMNQEERQFFSD